MKKQPVIAYSVAALVALATVGEGTAEAAYWQTQGSGCIVSPVSVAASYQSGGAFGYLGGSTATAIVAQCPITAVNMNGTRPTIGFYTLDNSTSGVVTFHMQRMRKASFNSTVETICSGSS